MRNNQKKQLLIPTVIALLISSQFFNTALAQAIAATAAGNTVTDTNTNSNLTNSANAASISSSTATGGVTTDTGGFTSLPITSSNSNTDANTISSTTLSSSISSTTPISSSLTFDTFATASSAFSSSSTTDNTFATPNAETSATNSTTSSLSSTTPFSSSDSGFSTSTGGVPSDTGFNNATVASSSSSMSSSRTSSSLSLSSSSASSSSSSSSSSSLSSSSRSSTTTSSTSSSSSSFSSSVSATDSSTSSTSSNSITTKPIGTHTTVIDGQTIYSNIYTTITATASVLPGGKQNGGSGGGLSSKNKKIVIGCVVGIGVPLLIALGILVYYFFIKSKKVNFIDSDGKVVTAVKANKFTKLWYKIFLGKNANDRYDPSSTPPGMEEMEKSNNEGYTHSLRNSGPENITNMNIDNDMFERDVYLDENGNPVPLQGSAAPNVGRAATAPTGSKGNNSATQRNIDGDIVPGRKSYHGQTRSSVGTPYPINDPFTSGALPLNTNDASNATSSANNNNSSTGDNRYSGSTSQSQQVQNDMSNKSSSNANSSNYHDPYANSDEDSGCYEGDNNGINARNY